jgi:hypothetical protein
MDGSERPEVVDGVGVVRFRSTALVIKWLFPRLGLGSGLRNVRRSDGP